MGTEPGVLRPDGIERREGRNRGHHDDQPAQSRSLALYSATRTAQTTIDDRDLPRPVSPVPAVRAVDITLPGLAGARRHRVLWRLLDPTARLVPPPLEDAGCSFRDHDPTGGEQASLVDQGDAAGARGAGLRRPIRQSTDSPADGWGARQQRLCAVLEKDCVGDAVAGPLSPRAQRAEGRPSRCSLVQPRLDAARRSRAPPHGAGQDRHGAESLREADHHGTRGGCCQGKRAERKKSGNDGSPMEGPQREWIASSGGSATLSIFAASPHCRRGSANTSPRRSPWRGCQRPSRDWAWVNGPAIGVRACAVEPVR